MRTVCQSASVLLLLLSACNSMGGDTDSDQDRGHTIALDSQVIDTRLAVDPTTSSAGDGYQLVKFPGPITAEQLTELESHARVYTYLPHDTFLVRPLAQTNRIRAGTQVGASWTGVYRPEFKIARNVGDLAAIEPDQSHTVMATVYPDSDLSTIVEAATRLPGATVVGADRAAKFSRIRLRIDGNSLVDAASALADIPDVFWVDVEGHRQLLNDTTIWVGQSGLNAGMTTPVFDHGIHGEGQVVGYVDTGIDPDMCYFRDTARGLPPTNACNNGTVVNAAQRKVLAVDFLTSSECAGGIANTEWDTQGHGSHVAGTIAGDNFANPIAHDAGDGMAPGAKLVVQDAGFSTDNCGDLPGIGCPVVDLTPIFQQAYTQGARIHTNSWGDNENAAVQNNYTAASQDVDDFMFTHPDMLILFAAGNSGPGTGSVGSPSTNKNGISVGATQRATAANSMASFSSCGPTRDNRIKPDLTMPGQSIVSARNDTNAASNNCATTTMSGTSMASPAAAGMAALVRQFYTDGFYPTGAAVTANRFTPTAALVKATMLNSTAVMTGTGTGPVPNNCQGWGRVLLDDALFFTGQARTMFVADDPGFAQGAAGTTKTFSVNVAAGQRLRVTLGWTDFPSTPAASVNLNNDLDLTVSGPSGTFLGNVFSNSQSTTGGTADRRNNVEQVTLNTPAAGTYTITVRAFNVPSSAQPFALVVSGGVSVAGGNRAPIANAGPDATGTVGTQVTLNGAGSSDPDGNPLTFAWTQTAGPAVTITTPNAAVAHFTPTVAGTYTFQLQVSDGSLSSTDSVTITVGGAVDTVFSDDFEAARGWTTNPNGTDTATTGAWERANPDATTSGGTIQVGTTTSGSFDLVTGGAAGASVGANDVDGGTTSIQSPAITLPASGTITLAFSAYFSHLNNSSADDFLRVQIVGATTTTVFQQLGSAAQVNGAFVQQTANISAFAGQTVRILITAADNAGGSLVEAGVDDVLITRQ